MSLATFHETCRKLESGIDEELKSYYVPTAAIADVARFNSRRALTVGLKGVGKTAAYRYFTEFEDSPDVVIGITSDKFSLHLPNNNLHFSTCRKQFEHDLIMEALRAVVQQRNSLKKTVKAQLLDDARAQVDSYTAMLRQLGARTSGLGISVLGCGFTLPIKTDSPVAVGLREDKDVKTALSVLKKICASGVKIRLVVDDPEQVFSASRQLDIHLIGGFCLAALRLAEMVPGIKIITLLKTHVYYPILVDVDDLRNYPDHMGRLCWSKEELVEMVADRLHWAKISWTEAFGGTEKESREMLISNCENVRNGPRDLLRWIDLSLQTSRSKKVDVQAMAQSKRRMSIDSLGELESAHSEHYPRLRAVIEVVFSRDLTRNFTFSELKQHIQDLLLKDEEMKALSRLDWMQKETSQTLPELLFETGATALTLGQRLILPYEEGYDNESFRAADHFSLTPALVDALK